MTWLSAVCRPASTRCLTPSTVRAKSPTFCVDCSDSASSWACSEMNACVSPASTSAATFSFLDSSTALETSSTSGTPRRDAQRTYSTRWRDSVGSPPENDRRLMRRRAARAMARSMSS